MSAASFLHSSFLQAISAVMLLSVHVQKVPLMLLSVHVQKVSQVSNTSALPSCRPDVISTVLSSLSAHSFPLTWACQSSRSIEVFAAEDFAWLCSSRGQPIPKSTFCSRFCENDGMCDLQMHHIARIFCFRPYPSTARSSPPPVLQLSLPFVHTAPCRPTMSSLLQCFGLATDLTPFICHSVLLGVHLLYLAHFHFALVTYWTMLLWFFASTLVLCLHCFVYSPSILLDHELPTRPVPCD